MPTPEDNFARQVLRLVVKFLILSPQITEKQRNKVQLVGKILTLDWLTLAHSSHILQLLYPNFKENYDWCRKTRNRSEYMKRGNTVPNLVMQGPAKVNNLLNTSPKRYIHIKIYKPM